MSDKKRIRKLEKKVKRWRTIAEWLAHEAYLTEVEHMEDVKAVLDWSLPHTSEKEWMDAAKEYADEVSVMWGEW